MLQSHWYRGPRFLAALLVALLAAAPAATAHHWGGLNIWGAPPTAASVGMAYSFTPQTTDWRNNTRVFAIANKPAWAQFSSSTGTLSGTPSAGSAGTYAGIVIAVSDGRSSAALPAFTIQVAGAAAPPPPSPPPPSPPPSPPPPSPPPSPQPPVISGTPVTSVTAGTAYAFQPAASDPAGLTVSFSVQNKPSWASFSIASGLLSGTPAATQTGTYANVVISASDGQASSALPAFSITVNAAPPKYGSALLNLTAPTQNTDGSPLIDLAGFRLYYGSSPSALTQVVQLSDPTLTSYTLGSLASGTWYFGATAYSASGTESAMSALASKTIP